MRSISSPDTDEFLWRRIPPSWSPNWLFPALIFRNLKKVRLTFARNEAVVSRLNGLNVTKWKSEGQMTSYAILHGIIDSSLRFYFLPFYAPQFIHVPPIYDFDSYILISTVKSEAGRDKSEVLAFLELGPVVWVLVGVSLLLVSALAAYLSYKKNPKNFEGYFKSWTKSVWIHTADILNNYVPEAARGGPEVLLRSCWLFGVAFLIQLWGGSLTGNLITNGESDFINSFEDLSKKPWLLCLISKDSFWDHLKKGHPRYEMMKTMNKRLIDWIGDEEASAILSSGEGITIGQEKTSTSCPAALMKGLKDNKKLLYFGQERYDGMYGFMEFNKRLPRAIKDDIDYLTSRLTETRQTEPFWRKAGFRSREYIFDSENPSSPPLSFTPSSVTYLSTIFRVWMIGIAMAILVFGYEISPRKWIIRRWIH